MFCYKCGAENLENANFCVKCGTSFSNTETQQHTSSNRLTSEQLKAEQQLSVDDELGLFVGKSAYQEYFKRKWFDGRPNLENRDLKKFSPNLMGFLFTTLYMGYRKMYFEVLWITGLISTLDIILMHMTGSENKFIPLVYLSLGASVNMLYYGFCKKKILKLKEVGYDTQSYKIKLSEQGGTSVAGIFIALAIVIAVILLMYPLLAPSWYWE